MLEHTHLRKKRVGLIRRDEEGPALSKSAAGVLEGGEEENRKKKTKNIKIQWRRRMVVLGWPQFPQLLLGRGVVRIRDETTKQQSTRESPSGEFLSPSGPQLAQPYRVVPAPTFLWLGLCAGDCLALTFASLE